MQRGRVVDGWRMEREMVMENKCGIVKLTKFTQPERRHSEHAELARFDQDIAKIVRYREVKQYNHTSNRVST